MGAASYEIKVPKGKGQNELETGGLAPFYMPAIFSHKFSNMNLECINCEGFSIRKVSIYQVYFIVKGV